MFRTQPGRPTLTAPQKGAVYMTSQEQPDRSHRAEVLRPDEAADYLGVTIDMLQRWRTAGTGPAFLPWGRRTVRYRLRDLDDWLDGQCTAANTAEAAKIRRRAKLFSSAPAQE